MIVGCRYNDGYGYGVIKMHWHDMIMYVGFGGDMV